MLHHCSEYVNKSSPSPNPNFQKAALLKTVSLWIQVSGPKRIVATDLVEAVSKQKSNLRLPQVGSTVDWVGHFQALPGLAAAPA